MDQIVAQQKAAIPILISQLTDQRKTREPIFDFWNQTTSGDIAYFILRDLFTEPDSKTFNLSGIQLPDQNCPGGAETCWRAFVRKYGRKSIQAQWRAAWHANRDRIYWVQSARCFRVR